MRRTPMFKMLVDVIMTMLILLLMAFQITGRVVHEWLGVSLYVIVFIHQALNAHWYKRMGRRSRTGWQRMNRIILILLILLMVLILASGIMISREVFSFLGLRMAAIGRPLHKLSTSWGFLLISVHVGMHCHMMMGMLMGKVRDKKLQVAINWCTKAIGVLLAAYGTGVFFYRRIWERFSLVVMFTSFDFTMPVLLVVMENAALMGMFAWISHHIFSYIRRLKRPDKINTPS